MTDLAFVLILLLTLGVGAVWFAITMPMLQWTLAWLKRREEAALAELFEIRAENKKEDS